MIFIKEYTNKKIICSDGKILEGNFILSNNGVMYPLIKNSSTEDFLSEVNNFKSLSEFSNECEIALIGCGDEFIIPSLSIKNYIKSINLGLEWSITSSLFHIFNLLTEDERNCVGLFINE